MVGQLPIFIRSLTIKSGIWAANMRSSVSKETSGLDPPWINGHMMAIYQNQCDMNDMPTLDQWLVQCPKWGHWAEEMGEYQSAKQKTRISGEPYGCLSQNKGRAACKLWWPVFSTLFPTIRCFWVPNFQTNPKCELWTNYYINGLPSGKLIQL